MLITRTVSIASLSAATTLPAVAWLLDAPAATVAFTASLALLVWWTHRDNVSRLLAGEEHAFGRRVAGDATDDHDADR